MEYEIKGGNLPVAVCRLNQGEAMFTQSGAMGWMTPNIDMQTNMEGGLFGGIARAFAGESLFMNTFTCTSGEGTVAFPSAFPGNIISFDLQPGQSLIAQKRAFLAAERSVQVSVFFRRSLGTGLFGGEGFIMQKVTGPGRVFFEVDGSVINYTLQPGQMLKVGTGHVALFSETVHMDITTLKGFKNILFGGEGLFLTTLTGPGEIWLQTITVPSVAQALIPYLPTSNNS